MIPDSAKVILVVVSVLSLIYPILFTVQFYFLSKRIEKLEKRGEENDKGTPTSPEAT